MLLLLSAAPVARSLARSRAEALGLRLSIGGAGLGWGLVRLRDVAISSPELPGMTATLSRVDIVPGMSGSVRRIGIHGGSILLHGSKDQLERQIDAWRAARFRGPGRGSGSLVPLSVDGVYVAWTSTSDASRVQLAWGARYDRDREGHEAIGVDLARAALSGARIQISRGQADLARDGRGRVLRSVAAAGLSATVDLDSAGSAVEAQRAPAADLSGPSGAADSSPSFGDGPKLRAELGRAARAAASVLRASTKLELSDARLALLHAGQALNVGPAKIVLEREADQVRLAVISSEGERAAPIRFDIAVPLADGAVDVGLAGGPVSLAALGVREHDMGLEEVDQAEMEVSGRATLASDGRALYITGRSRVSDLSLLQPKLSSDPVRGLRVALGGRADLALDGSRIHLDDVDISVGKVKILTNGELERSEGHAKGKLHVEIPLAACTDMLASIPPGLVPLLSGLEVSGTFAFAGDLSFDTRRPRDTRVAWDAGNECRITRVPAALAPSRFARPWVRTVLGPGGVPTTIETGPGTPTWVPLFDVTPHMATSVVVCEDASFWVHDGFNQKSIRDSIRDNLIAGRFVRGASTVSMQLAKNLYLRREKTLSRKLQEAVLTLLLEQTLTKEQILELYLNVIEFAPGVYGIGPAAAHYFHSTPRDLSLGQSLYLVSILPNPKVHHFKADGSLTDTWAEYLRHLMEIAHKIHRIDDRDLAAGLAETVHLGVPASEAPDSESEDRDPADLTPPDL